jgi:signal transduction histidine kinase
MMLTESGPGVYVDQSYGYDRLEEILPSSSFLEWPRSGGCFNLLSHERIERKSYSQIMLRLKSIWPTPYITNAPCELDPLSILNPPQAGEKPGVGSWFADEIQAGGDPYPSLRVLISGMSHIFNDLLMGIEGNLSLIRISLGPKHVFGPVLENTEELIHSGSFMVNLLLGYLADRRSKTRQMRFRQLLNETCGSDADAELARRRFERWMATASKFETLAHISENCAHIFKSLILNLRSCMEGMGSEVEFNAATCARFKQIRQLSDSIDLIAEKLLCFAGSEAAELKTISIANLINERLEAIGQQHGQIRTVRYISRCLPTIQADDRLIANVIDQVLQNAQESMPEGGCLTVRAKQLTLSHACNKHSGTDTRSYVLVEIIDTGCGISIENRDRIFEPFFTTKPHGKGHGLGLSMAMGALRVNGGFIDFESQPGRGSRFKLYLKANNVKQIIQRVKK